MNSKLQDELHRALIQDCIVHSCLNCEQFNAEKERCTHAPEHPLPTTVVVYGCKSWEPSIPF